MITVTSPQVTVMEMVTCLSNAIDLVSPALVDHHRRVAYVSYSLAAEYGLSAEEQDMILLAGLLHDIGAMSLRDRLDTLTFDSDNIHEHSELGYLALVDFEPLSRVAELVRYHHVPWDDGRVSDLAGARAPFGSHFLHLADRVVGFLGSQREVLGQARDVRDRIIERSGQDFVPALVEVFRSLAEKEYFWLDATSPAVDSLSSLKSRFGAAELTIDRLLDFAKVFSRIIDFRSRFTATHSSGVATSAEALARFSGLSDRECRMMRVAGYLHDLGKLAVPEAILEKPAKLTEDEQDVMKTHAFHTLRILETVNGLASIATWAAYHHERIDGQGYPFKIRGEELPLGSRIMAVADVFTAITEDRPYRQGMTQDRALGILEQMAAERKLDSNIILALRAHFDEINAVRLAAQASAAGEYQELKQGQNGSTWFSRA